MNEQLTFDKDGNITEELTDRQTDRQTWTLDRKIEESIRALRLAADMSKTYYGAPLIVTYSGGKDSDVMLHLAERCLESDEFEVLNSHTSVDAPETVYHIREVFKRLNAKGIKATVNYPKDKNGKPITMWSLIPERKMPPTRIVRYCCSVLKETSTPNRLACLGVRAAESTKRQGRDIFGIRGGKYSEAIFFSLDHTEEVHHEAKDRDPVWDCTLIQLMRRKGDCLVNPIYDWLDTDVWEYIRREGIETNPLYAKGYKRVGCIGCPLASYSEVMREFNDYPQYKKAYLNAFGKMIERYDDEAKRKRQNWKTPEDVFDWWIETYKQVPKGQMNITDYIDE